MAETTNQTSPAMPRPVFAIFEGGGAKGIAHLGAAEAALSEGLEFIGVAGTSAGAFVAALLAAGYRGKELFNPEARGSDLLAQRNLGPTDLLGVTEWASFQQALAGYRRLLRWAFLAGVGGAWLGSRRTLSVMRVLTRNKGHFDTSGVREFVNDCLRSRLVELFAREEGLDARHVPTRIRFADLDYRRFKQLRPLKIVATDVGSGKAVLFSQDDTPEAEVGEAVAASIAIPLVFRPVTMGTHRGGPYADGGLTYNLPVGVFSEEKLAYERRFPSDPPVPIIAFTLEDPEPVPDRPAPRVDATLPGWLAAAARSGIFGSQEISRRTMADLIMVPLRTELQVLGFDADWAAVVRAFNAGRVDALRLLSRSLRLRPDRVKDVLRRFADGARTRIDTVRLAKGDPKLGRLRMALATPFGAKSLRIVHSFGMDADTDDRMIYDRDGPGVPQAFRERDLIAFDVASDGAGRPQLPVPSMMTKYEQALLWPGLRSVLAAPIFSNAKEWAKPAEERDSPLGVLVFDSDEDLLPALGDESLQDWLITASVAAAALATSDTNAE